MRIYRLATIALAATALALVARAVPAADFDLSLDIDAETTKHVTIEKAMTQGRDFINHVGIYLRFVPKKGTEQFPVFIDTENYLSCPDVKDQTWPVNDVKEVHAHDRSGVKVYAFFFDKPTCDTPVFHMKAVFGDV
jgi:hypothetical protein